MASPSDPPPAPISAALPDADGGNWVDRHAPPRLKPWLKLGRLDRPAGAWLLLLPCWQGLALSDALHRQPADWTLYLRLALGAVVMRAAGCAYNDIVDRDIDAAVARTAARPLASGQITLRGAWTFVVGCSLIGLLVLLSLNLWSIGLGLASLALVAAYPFMKRVTWWPQLWLGLTFNWGALIGFACASAGASGGMIILGEWMVLSHRWITFVFAPGQGPGAAALLLYASGIFWTLGYDTIYAVQDLEDDALAGVKSSARRLGAATPLAVTGFYAACALLALASGVVGGLGRLFYPALAVFAAHLLWQARSLNLAEPALALRLFRSNRTAGLILTVAIGLGRAGLPPT